MLFYPRQRLNLNLKDFFWLFFNLPKKEMIGNNDTEFLNTLKAYFETENIVLTPSATYSFFKIVKFLGICPGKKIALPANIYPSFPEIVKLRGGEPIFLEMDKDTLNIDYKEILKKNISNMPVLVPLHYGIIPYNLKEIVKILRKKNCDIIFDSVQYFTPDKYLIRNGEAIIYSFSRAKDLDLLGGGAIISKSQKLMEYIKKENKTLTSPSRTTLFKTMLKYFYIYSFTNKVIFPIITFPLLLFNSYFKKKVISSTPTILFKSNELNLDTLNKSYRMCNLQYQFGIRKLPGTVKMIEKRSIISNQFYAYIAKNLKSVSVPRISKSIFYTFPIISQDNHLSKKLIRKGIDTKESFLEDCSKRSSELFKKTIHIPVYNIEIEDFEKFKDSFLECINIDSKEIMRP